MTLFSIHSVLPKHLNRSFLFNFFFQAEIKNNKMFGIINLFGRMAVALFWFDVVLNFIL